MRVNVLSSDRPPSSLVLSSQESSYGTVGEYAVGTYVTKPGTPLGEPERINLLNPVASVIGIRCSNLTAIGGTLDISEVHTTIT